MRNIALFIDGTQNHPGRCLDTNVRKLYEAARDHAVAGQVVHYLGGVGTEVYGPLDGGRAGAAGRHAGLRWLPWRLRDKLASVSGWGTSFRIREAYRFLCEQYRPGDRVYLFGFSRGAFAARSLAGFVGTVGLLYADALDEVHVAWRLYESGSPADAARLAGKVREMCDRRGVSPEEAGLPVYMIGVWDTVAALGNPWRQPAPPAERTTFHRTDVPANVTHARHALALHELRRMFEPLPWQGCAPWQSLVQTWFAGAHADVGGGYAQAELSDVALRWMADEARRLGLALGPAVTRAPRADGPWRLHHQLRGPFVACRATVRRHLSRHHELPGALASFRVHRSAFDRLCDAKSSDERYRRRDVRPAFRAADDETLRLLVEASLTRGVAAVWDDEDMPSQRGSVPVPVTRLDAPWVAALAVDDLRGRRARTRYPGCAAEAGDGERLAAAFALSFLFDGEDFARAFVREVLAEAGAALDAVADRAGVERIEREIIPGLRAIAGVLDRVGERLGEGAWRYAFNRVRQIVGVQAVYAAGHAAKVKVALGTSAPMAALGTIRFEGKI